jgi:hypothetical protein
MGSVDLNVVTICGMTHIKTMFSFSTGTGKYFSGKSLSSSDSSVTQLIHILHFFTINMTYENSQKKNSTGAKFGELGGQTMGPPLPMQRSGNSLSRKART